MRAGACARTPNWTCVKALRTVLNFLLVPLLALPLTASPARAAGQPAEAPLASAGGTGSRWTAATLLTDGARVSSSMVLSGLSSPAALSARVYLDGVRVSTANLTLRAAGGGRGVLVDAPAVGGVVLHVDQVEDDSDYRFADVSVTVTVNPDGPVRVGRVSVVLYAAAAVLERWGWSLSGAPGARLLGTSHGPEAFAYSPRDFDTSQLSVYAGESVPGLATAHGRLNSGAVKSLDLDPRLVGSYSTFGTDRLTIVGPSAVRSCTPSCDIDPNDRDTRLEARGRYSFRLDGSSVGTSGVGPLQQADTDVSLHGALVRPPTATGL